MNTGETEQITTGVPRSETTKLLGAALMGAGTLLVIDAEVGEHSLQSGANTATGLILAGVGSAVTLLASWQGRRRRS